MSAGEFILAKYENNSAVHVFPIRVQPETLALTLNGQANAQGAGSIDDELPTVHATGGRRKIGVHARTVSFKFTAAPASGGYVVGDRLTLPVFVKANWDKYGKGSTGTYLGAAIIRTGRHDENVV